jgi:hypothetical protein
MSEILRRIVVLVLHGDYLVTDHGFDELVEDGIVADEVIRGVAAAVPIEDYPDRRRGPSVLALQHDAESRPLHVLWAIPARKRGPAVLVTGYRSNPALWTDDFRQ